MQLRDGTSVLIRSDGSVQVGLGSQSAVITGLDKGEQSYMQTLRFRASTTATIGRAHKRSIDLSRMAEVEKLLDQDGLILRDKEVSSLADGPRVARRDGDNQALVNRADVNVDIVVFDCGDPLQFHHMLPFLEKLIRSLKGANITQIDIDYRGEDMRGMSKTVIRDGLGLQRPLGSGAHYAIALFARASSGAQVYDFQTDGIPHVSVVFHEDLIQVGPFVRPGESPCLGCIDRNFRDIDPDWPALMVQCRDQPFPVLSPDLLKTSAAMTARLLANEVDGLGVRAGEVRMIDEDFIVERTIWPPNHDCTCNTDPTRWDQEGVDEFFLGQKPIPDAEGYRVLRQIEKEVAAEARAKGRDGGPSEDPPLQPMHAVSPRGPRGPKPLVQARELEPVGC